MKDQDNIISILNAVNAINSKPKKNSNTLTKQNIIPKLKHDLIISPDVDRLIVEAEEYNKSQTASSNITSNKTQQSYLQKENAYILTDEIKEPSFATELKIIEYSNTIEDLKKKENKLLLQIEEFKKNKILSSNEYNNNLKPDNFTPTVNTKELFQSIYKQVEEQKQLFLELKKKSIKIERDSDVYKENYERLIIENNDLKIRLKIAKEQIVSFETNKTDLLSALDQLNEILSKNNISNISSTEKSLNNRETDIKENS